MVEGKGRVFTVERRAMERERAAGGSAPARPYPDGFMPTDFQQAFLAEIAALRGEMAEIREAIGLGLVAPAADPAVGEGAPPQERIDYDLRIEIAQMVRSIGRAKAQIAAIKHPMASEDQMQTASMQLDTIVQTTETATNEIMSSVDQIENVLKQIHGFTLDDPEVQQLIDRASNHLISIIEACSFQDLTGQRIMQVVKTLRFIESRILAMIDIWGGLEAFKDLPVPPAGEGEEAHEEEGLLNGPALGNKGLSQDDIDALFD